MTNILTVMIDRKWKQKDDIGYINMPDDYWEEFRDTTAMHIEVANYAPFLSDGILGQWHNSEQATFTFYGNVDENILNTLLSEDSKYYGNAKIVYTYMEAKNV